MLAYRAECRAVIVDHGEQRTAASGGHTASVAPPRFDDVGRSVRRLPVTAQAADSARAEVCLPNAMFTPSGRRGDVSSGFVGLVGSRRDRRVPDSRTDAHDEEREAVLLDTDWAWIAVRSRPTDRVSSSRDEAMGRTVAVLGSLIDVSASVPRPTSAAELLAGGYPLPAEHLRRFEGDYQVLVIDEPRRTIRLIGDHLGSRPLFYSDTPGPSAFGRSESEVVSLLGRDARLSSQGVAGFLAIGFPVGGLTLTDGVSRLRPARELAIASDGRRKEHAWWDLSFGGEGAGTLDDAVDELHELALVAHRAATAEGDDFHLALTGGIDSRLVLGILREIGRPPARAFTWLSQHGVPGSDPEIARILATIAGVPHEALAYRPEAFTDHLDTWLRASALRSDNLGHICAGPDFLEDHRVAPRPVFLGDHVLGLGGEFANRDDAIASVLRLPWPDLSPSLAALLPTSDFADIQQALREQVSSLLADADATDPKDLHHYLYFHVGIFNWLLAPGYYKEPAVAARRPLASRALLDAAARWPAGLRNDKRVVVTLLQRRYRDLRAVPVADRSALVDWTDAVQNVPAVRETLHDMLDEAADSSHPLLKRLRHEEIRRRFAALQQARTPSIGGSRMRSVGVRIRRVVGRVRVLARPLRHLERLARRTIADGGNRAGEVRQLFRIGLLARYERLLRDDTGRADAPTGSDRIGTDGAR